MRGIPKDAVRKWRAHRASLASSPADALSAVEANLPFPASRQAYLSLFARCEAFHPGDLDRLVFQEKRLRVFPLPQGGNGLVPVERIPALLALHQFAAGSRARRSKTQRRIEAEVAEQAPAVLQALRGGPWTREELIARAFPSRRPTAAERGRLDRAVAWLARRGDLVCGFARPTLMAPATVSLPAPGERLPALSTENYRFLEDVALHYFGAAGPATRDDFLWWTGLSRSAARHTIEDLAGLLDEIDLEGGRSAWFMPEEDAADLRAGRYRTSPRVAFLPPRDPLVVSRRRGLESLAMAGSRTPITGKSGRAASSPIVQGGGLVGGWAWNSAAGVVEAALAPDLPETLDRAVQLEAARLGQFIGQALFGDAGIATRRPPR